MNIPKTLAELHHVYIMSCDASTLMDALESRGVPRQGSPDVYTYECQQLKVDDARAISERATTNPLVLARRVFVVSAAVIMHEAQNALLKMLEDPRGNAVFFFLVPFPERLLSTFRSRAHIITSVEEKEGPHKTDTDAMRFLKAKPAERLTMLELFTKKRKDDEERDFSGILLFLDELERAMGTRNPEGLRAVYRAKRYVTDKGALVKPLFEQVALLS